jgi:hypothetical protein
MHLTASLTALPSLFISLAVSLQFVKALYTNVSQPGFPGTPGFHEISLGVLREILKKIYIYININIAFSRSLLSVFILIMITEVIYLPCFGVYNLHKKIILAYYLFQ